MNRVGAVIGRERRSALWFALPVLLIGSTGCFATRGDVRVLQGDINTVRAESQRSAQTQAQALAQTASILQAVSDSLSRLSSRQLAFEGDARGEFRRVNEQLVQVQELLGQSASIIRGLRAELETASRMGGMPPMNTPPGSQPPVDPAATSRMPPAAPPSGGAVIPNPGLPGPNQLYQDGVDHFRSGSYESARIAFGDLLLNYPGADVAAEAQFWIAESYAAEGRRPAAETAYAAVVSKYPDSPRAPDALYKRAVSLIEQENTAAAKPLLELLIQRYPRSNAADFAKDRLAAIP